MLTSPDPTTERGGSPWRSAALGVVSVLVALALPWALFTFSTPANGDSAAVDVPGGQRPDDTSSTGTTASPEPVASPPSFAAAPPVELEAAPSPPAPAPGVPRRLVVPVLGVDAPVIPISVEGGVLVPPADPQVLGWWQQGAMPGAARGGSLITGHTVSSGGGAFDDLDTLQVGDVVRVRTGERVLRYAVSGVRVYRKARIARDAERIFSQSVPGRLVLVTCEDWNGSYYESNAVVFAERF